MKKFKCSDMGINCKYEVTGESEDELVRKASEHGKNVHNMKLSMDDEKKVRQQIKNV